MFGHKLTVLLVLAAAGLLALGAMSALAGPGPVGHGADQVAGIFNGSDDGNTNGAVENDTDADTSEEGDEADTAESGDADDVDADGDGSGTGHEACFAATEHARTVLTGLQDGSFFEDLNLPDQAKAGSNFGGSDGVAKALSHVENCGTGGDGE